MSYARQLARLGADPGARRRAGARSRASARSIPTRAATPRATSSALQYKLRPTENSELARSPTSATYRFNLFSNFTLFLRDPENGDEIEQVDRRTFYGGKVSYRVVHELGGVRFDTTIGGDVRSDDIHEELWNTLHRRQLTAVRSNDVHETLRRRVRQRGDHARCTWLRADVGGRADLLVVRRRQPLADDRPDRARRAASTPRTSSARRRA